MPVPIVRVPLEARVVGILGEESQPEDGSMGNSGTLLLYGSRTSPSFNSSTHGIPALS